jgi:5-methylcytosine-specific restriction endonuclease McrA
MSQHSHDSRAWRRYVTGVKVTGPTCWICGHPGSDQGDHALPVSLFPELAADPANWRPAHGVAGCPTCGMKCNQARGNKLELPRPPVTSRRW